MVKKSKKKFFKSVHIVVTAIVLGMAASLGLVAGVGKIVRDHYVIKAGMFESISGFFLGFAGRGQETSLLTKGLGTLSLGIHPSIGLLIVVFVSAAIAIATHRVMINVYR